MGAKKFHKVYYGYVPLEKIDKWKFAKECGHEN